MPFVYREGRSGKYVLAYECIEGSGNFIKMQFYSNLQALLTGNFDYQTSLMKRIHIPAAPNTYTNDVSSNIKNIGTPSITSAQIIDNIGIIYIRFHFTLDDSPEQDTPGCGVVTYKPSKEGSGEYFNWQAFFDNESNNAIEVARNVQGGKIGQRASIKFNQKLYYLFEAQLNRNFDWKNWRLFLYSPDENRALQLNLKIDLVVDFANPGLTQYPDRTVLTLFVPSQAIDPGVSTSAQPGCLIITLPAMES